MMFHCSSLVPIFKLSVDLSPCIVVIKYIKA